MTTPSKQSEPKCSHCGETYCDPINSSSYWYRVQNLVLDRTLMEAMPKEWQHRLVELLDETEQHFDFMHKEWPNVTYAVTPRDKHGRFTKFPFGHYKRPDEELLQKLTKKKS